MKNIQFNLYLYEGCDYITKIMDAMIELGYFEQIEGVGKVVKIGTGSIDNIKVGEQKRNRYRVTIAKDILKKSPELVQYILDIRREGYEWYEQRK